MIPFHASSARAYYCSNSDVNQKYPELNTILGGFLTKTPPFPKELQVPTSASNPRRMGAWQVTRATWIDCQEVTLAPPVRCLRNGSAGAGAVGTTSLRGFDLSRWKREWFLGQLGPAPGKCVYPQSCWPIPPMKSAFWVATLLRCFFWAVAWQRAFRWFSQALRWSLWQQLDDICLFPARLRDTLGHKQTPRSFELHPKE